MIYKKARYFGILICKVEEEKIITFHALYYKSISLFFTLKNQYQDPIFIVNVEESKRSIFLKVI